MTPSPRSFRPVPESHPAHTPHPQPPVRAVPAAPSVLLVDDDAMVREATAWLLSGAGYDVHEAVDGVDALDQMTRQGPPDLVITDVNMPRMGGLALIERARQRWPSMPVLLVSGRTQPAGTQAYMRKPFAAEALMQAVSNALLRSRRARDGGAAV